MTSLEIRAAREPDTSEVMRLIRAKAEFDGCLQTLKASESTLREALFSTPPRTKALVAVLGGAIVGLATYYDIYSSFIGKPGIWLDDLYVYEAYRNRRIGRALLVELCRIARAGGCGRIDWVVAKDNDNGRAFYESLGAEVFEQVRHARLTEVAISRLVAESASGSS